MKSSWLHHRRYKNQSGKLAAGKMVCGIHGRVGTLHIHVHQQNCTGQVSSYCTSQHQHWKRYLRRTSQFQFRLRLGIGILAHILCNWLRLHHYYMCLGRMVLA